MDAKLTGKIINQKRKEKELTQLQLAQILNVSNRTISKWENGDGFPDITLLPDISRELDVTIDELLTGIKPEPVIEIKEVEVPCKESNIKKSRSKLIIWEVIAFCISIGVNIIGGATEIMFFNYTPFYAFVEIYLLVASTLFAIVSITIFITAIVRYKLENEHLTKGILKEIYLFTIVTAVFPVFTGYRMFLWLDFNIRFSILCIIAFIVYSVIMFKKIYMR